MQRGLISGTSFYRFEAVSMHKICACYENTLVILLVSDDMLQGEATVMKNREPDGLEQWF
jgi:purine-nucleoside phosphorylase